MKRLVILTLMCAVLSVTVGCGDDKSESNNSANNATNNTSPDMDQTPDMASGDMTYNPPATYASSYHLRFDTLKFTIPRKLSGINSILAKNFDQGVDYPVIILVEMKDVDAEAGTLKLRGGSGAKTLTAETYEWDQDNEDIYFDGTLDKATGRVAGSLQNFKFVATFENEGTPLRSTIPINRLDFEGYLEPAADGSNRAQIRIGKLGGNITKEQADATMITIVPTAPPLVLTTLLEEAKLDLDLDGDGKMDAWKVEDASFSAVPTTIR